MKKKLLIDPPEEWQGGVVTLFATKYPEKQIKSCAEGTQPSNVFFLKQKIVDITLVWDESYLDLPKYLMSEFCQTRARG